MILAKGFISLVYSLFPEDDLGSLKVIDFGNAIHHIHKEVSLYYEDFEVQTPLYRAPEVRNLYLCSNSNRS